MIASDRRAAAAVTWIVVAACASPAPAPSTSAAETGTVRIVVDGAFDDWAQVPVAGRASMGDARAAVIREVRAAADGEALFLHIAMSSPLVLQAHTAATRIVLDVDGDADTGRTADGLAGADVVLEFSPAPASGGTRGGFASWAADGRRGTAHDAGFAALPTHVSETFEVRIERAVLESFAGVATGERSRGRLVSDLEGGAVVSADFTWRPPPAAQVTQPAGAEAVTRAPGTTVRVIAWNVADQGIRRRPDAFARVLRALDADVVLLDELPATMTAAELSSFLAGVGGGWTLALGDGGGRQRAAVASRLPLEPARDFARVGYPDSVDVLLPLATFAQTRRDLAGAREDGLSTAGAIVDVDGRRVLFVAIDLACCGGAESVEDRFRRMQAGAIHSAAGATVARASVHAVVFGGDLNLVGSRRPLDVLVRGADPHGGDLSPAYALQLDGRSAATWRQDGPFGPGRLDWILHSPSTLRVMRAFAFESGDLSAAALARLGVDAADSDITSDHLPVVADLAWTDAPRSSR